MASKIQGPRPRTQKNFKTKDKPSRGQGQGPKTQAQVFSKKKIFKKFFKRSQKKGSLKFFFRQKRSLKIFFRQFPLEKNKKRPSQIFCKVSGAFQQNFNGSKNSAVLEPRTGNFRGIEASRPRPRTSKLSSRTPPLILTIHIFWLS